HTFEVVQYRSTPMGKDTREMTNTPGSRYIRSFCWRAIALAAAEAGMFVIVNCRCVNSIETLMSTTSTAAMICTEMTSEPRQIQDSEAPEISEYWICSATTCSSAPIAAVRDGARAMSVTSMRTRNTAKKIAICSNIRRQDAHG